MTAVEKWFKRKFVFAFPVERFPDLCIRLRGTPARLEEIVRGIPSEKLVQKPGDKWSAQEHAGHLADIESLWFARVNDFLARAAELTVADLSNRKTHAADHNARALSDILGEFRGARVRLLERLEQLHPEQFSRSMLHPRLKQPMRLVDHLYFAAEHDDHHLAMIWELIGG